ncbi:hypothetical protein Tco_0431227 [Tanacetum coccineum]
MVPSNNLGPDLNGKDVNEAPIQRYLKGTLNLGLWYPKCSGFDLKGYSDSDYTGCNMDRKSTLAEAEYVAAAGCCANILWMKSQLSDYDIIFKKVPIFFDKLVLLQSQTIQSCTQEQSTLISDITSSEIIFSKGTLNDILFPLNINLLISSPSL